MPGSDPHIAGRIAVIEPAQPMERAARWAATFPKSSDLAIGLILIITASERSSLIAGRAPHSSFRLVVSAFPGKAPQVR